MAGKSEFFDRKFVGACVTVGTVYTLIVVGITRIVGTDAGNVAGLFLTAFALRIFEKFKNLRFSPNRSKKRTDLPLLRIAPILTLAAITFAIQVFFAFLVALPFFYLALESGPFKTNSERSAAIGRAADFLQSRGATGHSLLLLVVVSYIVIGIISAYRYDRVIAIFYAGAGAFTVIAAPTILFTIMRLLMNLKQYNVDFGDLLYPGGFLALVFSMIAMISANITSKRLNRTGRAT